MFGWLRKRGDKPEVKPSEYDAVTAYYEGSIAMSDYWDSENPDSFEGGLLVPHGNGKLTISFKGVDREVYQGDFNSVHITVLGSFCVMEKFKRAGLMLVSLYCSSKKIDTRRPLNWILKNTFRTILLQSPKPSRTTLKKWFGCVLW